MIRVDLNVPRRLMGRFESDPPVELLREDKSHEITERTVYAVTSEMGPGWKVWINEKNNRQRAPRSNRIIR